MNIAAEKGMIVKKKQILSEDFQNEAGWSEGF